MTTKRKNRPDRNSTAERIRRMFAQGIEIDEIDAQGNQVGSTSDQLAVGEAVDVMPALAAAAAPITGHEAPVWME